MDIKINYLSNCFHRLASSNTEALVWSCTAWNQTTGLKKIASHSALPIAVCAASAFDALQAMFYAIMGTAAFITKKVVCLANNPTLGFHESSRPTSCYKWATTVYITEQMRSVVILFAFSIIAPVVMAVIPQKAEKSLIRLKIIKNKVNWQKIVKTILAGTASGIAATLVIKTICHPGIWGGPLEQQCQLPNDDCIDSEAEAPLNLERLTKEANDRCSLLYYPVPGAMDSKTRQILNAFLQIFKSPAYIAKKVCVKDFKINLPEAAGINRPRNTIAGFASF